MFEVNGWSKFVEEDIFAEGCIPETSCYYSDKTMRFQASTVDDLIKSVMEFVGCANRAEVELDACDEAGRIDIQMLESDEGNPASPREIEQWRAGNCRLWLANYTFYAEFVDRHPVTLAA